jgi:hypothetical protein
MRHEAKEQKFMVFTKSSKSSHGRCLGSGDISTGNALLNAASSSPPNFHTMSLLSLPCLSTHQISKGQKHDIMSESDAMQVVKRELLT